MSSMIFSDEEARFLRVVLKLAERPPDDNRSSWMINGLDAPEKKVMPAGEFRILVIGDQGVGKTSLLTKVRTGAFPDPSTLPPSNLSHGSRHTITIESRPYTVDALELPASHLSSPGHLAQALAITDAAVLAYDVADAASLTYLKALAGTIHAALHHTPAPTPRGAFRAFSAPGTPVLTRPYHLLVVGAKNDVVQREVAWLEGHAAAAEFFGPAGVAGGSSVGFMEVSSRTGENVDSVFPLLGREVLKSRRERKLECCRLEQQQQQRRRRRRLFGTEGDGGSALAGGVWRRWYALKSSLSGGLFRKEYGK